MLRIGNDSSRSALVLSWSGAPHRITTRILVILLTSPLTIFPLFLFFSKLYHHSLEFGVFSPIFFGVGIILVSQGVTSYCRHLVLDRQTSTLLIENSFLPFLPRKMSISFHAIQKFEIIMGPEGENMKLSLHFRYDRGEIYQKNVYVPLSI